MIRTFARTLAGAGLTLAFAALAGCNASSTGNATMSVHLVDGPSLEYSALTLHVVKVEISKDGAGWITLGTRDVTVDLLKLTGGVAETLVDGASIPAGTYGQMRLVLGGGNTITTPDGTFPLKVPSGMQSGVKLNVHFDVAPDTTKDVFIDFDAHRSVFVHQAGMSQQYILRPVVRAFDKVVTGAVQGTLTDAATSAPLPGVEVMAETLDATGNPSVARRTTTDERGAYLLDLLPVDGAYWVVAQPRVSSAAYQPNAAGPLDVTAADPVLTRDVAFTKADSPGGLAGTISGAPASTQSDEVTLLGTVPSVGHTFVLRSTGADDGVTPEAWAIDLLPAATYSLFVTRATEDGSGGYTYAVGPTATAAVAAGTTTTGVTLAAPTTP